MQLVWNSVENNGKQRDYTVQRSAENTWPNKDALHLR